MNPLNDAELDNHVKKLVEAKDPKADLYKETYMGGITLAHTWWQEARLSRSPSEEMYKRILDGAINRYKQIFGNK